jgi:hypothetical protein
MFIADAEGKARTMRHVSRNLVVLSKAGGITSTENNDECA